MISVIVPVYNVEKYLDNCVESIVNQTYKDLEIILVDDGSPDNCPAMCDEWAKKDKRIKVIHKQNGGLSSARNAGLETATGEYVAFVDSDDSIDINMYEIMENMFSDDIDIVMCGYQKINSSEEIVSCGNTLIEKKKLSIGELYDDIFGHLNNASWNKLYRASIIDNIRFPNGIVHGEDLIFNLHYLRHCCNGVKCNGEFYHYFSRENSITKSKFSENKFLEIKAKDISREIILNECPAQSQNADKFCFRARMNVLRSIYSSHNEQLYRDKVKEIKKYIMNNYPNVKIGLAGKEKIEYILFIYFNLFYRILTRK